MATGDDRRAVGGAAAPLSAWFVATGAVLIVSLLAAFFVQARQHALLNQAVRDQDDYLVLNLFQLETEYLRLRERWRQSAQDAATAREQLQLRYEIFVSRIGLLQTDRAARLLGDTPEYAAALRALRDFVDRGDLYLGPGRRRRSVRPRCRRCWATWRRSTRRYTRCCWPARTVWPSR